MIAELVEFWDDDGVDGGTFFGVEQPIGATGDNEDRGEGDGGRDHTADEDKRHDEERDGSPGEGTTFAMDAPAGHTEDEASGEEGGDDRAGDSDGSNEDDPAGDIDHERDEKDDVAMFGLFGAEEVASGDESQA